VIIVDDDQSRLGTALAQWSIASTQACSIRLSCYDTLAAAGGFGIVISHAAMQSP